MPEKLIVARKRGSSEFVMLSSPSASSREQRELYKGFKRCRVSAEYDVVQVYEGPAAQLRLDSPKKAEAKEQAQLDAQSKAAAEAKANKGEPKAEAKANKKRS